MRTHSDSNLVTIAEQLEELDRMLIDLTARQRELTERARQLEALAEPFRPQHLRLVTEDASPSEPAA